MKNVLRTRYLQTRAASDQANFNASGIDAKAGADARLIDEITPEFCLREAIAPLKRAGAVTLIGAPSFEHFQTHRAQLEGRWGPIAHVAMSAAAIRRAIIAPRGPQLAYRAHTRTQTRESCRGWSPIRSAIVLLTLVLAIAALILLYPRAATILLTAWAAITLASVTLLRSMGALVQLRQARRLGRNWRSHRTQTIPDAQLPKISVLVPLLRERDIASRLVKRLERLDYPRDRLDVLLILEAGDITTAATLQSTALPPWMRVVEVPPGPLRTKPRAMNYALDFTDGEIVGIYDAEDAPAPDQLRRVAEAFANASPDVACLQGVLDFYNTEQSWLTRCFTIDYATWFRLVLPGLVRLGFAIPLGGTTMFIRRNVLEKIGRWDAHNVTEDADLGIRLARRGFRTEFVASVTMEEATATVPTWVRQRSRWIKGYAMTWAVHMRQPLRLLRELGLKRFLGFQALFLGSLSQFVLAPVLWSFWLVLFGLPHPITDVAPWSVIVALAALFLLCEIATMAVAAFSVATPRHRRLIWWVPILHVYFPLSAIASWKGLAELITRPFFWDKTSHGKSPSPASGAPPPQPHPRPA